MRWRTLRTVVAVVVTAAIAAVSPVTAAAPKVVPLKTIGGLPSLPKGKANASSVVAVGAFDNVLPVVVRNNTTKAVSDVKVTATVFSGGRLVGTGSDQSIKPEVVAPGGLAIGYIYFKRDPPSGATYRFNVTTSPVSDSLFSAVDLPITTANYVDGQVVGIARNRTSKEIQGPLSVYATCFVGNKIAAMVSGFAEPDDAPPGGEVPFSLDFTRYGTTNAPTCQKITVAMTGYSF